MKKLSFLLILMIICSNAAFSGAIDRERVVDSKSFLSFTDNPKELNSIQNANHITTSFTLSGSNGEKVFTNPMPNLTITNFPISENQLGTVVLKRIRSAVDRNTILTMRTAEGDIPIEGPKVYSYFGKIRGSENSMVMLNYCKGELIGLIEHENMQKYNIIPFGDNNSNKSYSNKSYSNKSNVVHSVVSDQFGVDEFSQPLLCGTPDEPDYGNATDRDIKGYNSIQKESDLLQVNIIAESAYDFYALKGESTSRVIAYIEAVTNLSSKIYEDNINVVIYLKEIIINTDPFKDPYGDEENLTEKLRRMANYWKLNYKRKKRALGILFADKSNQPQGEIVAGIAYRGQSGYGVLCDKGDGGGYAVLGIDGWYNYPGFNYTWDVSVFLHETGHNFSSPHTHTCYFDPPIDSCVVKGSYSWLKQGIPDACNNLDTPIRRPGTIMSYCHLFNNTRSVGLLFHDRVKPLIRQAADNAIDRVKDSCVFISEIPLLKLLSPLGQEVLVGGTTTDIRWTQQNVGAIEILISSDNGQNWETVANDIAAEDTVYQWNVPVISSNDCFIMIVDANNPEISEMSIMAFEIQAAGIELTSSMANKRIGQRGAYNVKWNKTLVDRVNVLFSSNGGDNFETLKSGVNAKSVDVDIPDIESDNCLFRIEDSQNSNIFDESAIFAVGKEVAEIKRPAEGSTVCTHESIVNEYKFNIRWTSDFLEKINIELYDGTEWKKINGFVAIDASKKSSYDWRVPANVETEEAKLRIVLSSEPDFVVFTSENFIMDDCLTGVDDGNPANSNSLTILDIIPNPAQSEASVKINCGNTNIHTIDIMLVDEAGSIAAKFGKFDIAGTGENTFNIRTSNVAQGSYFIVIRSGNARASAPIKIIR